MLHSLNELYAASVERERALGDILEALRTGYNPNYQDMAVLDAVRGWDALRPHEEKKEEGEGTEGEVEVEQRQKQEKEGTEDDDEVLSASEVQERVQTLLNMNHELLLLEPEKPSNQEESVCMYSPLFSVLAPTHTDWAF
jgi:protein kinase C substrate 80K-H